MRSTSRLTSSTICSHKKDRIYKPSLAMIQNLSPDNVRALIFSFINESFYSVVSAVPASISEVLISVVLVSVAGAPVPAIELS